MWVGQDASSIVKLSVGVQKWPQAGQNGLRPNDLKRVSLYPLGLTLQIATS